MFKTPGPFGNQNDPIADAFKAMQKKKEETKETKDDGQQSGDDDTTGKLAK